MKVLRADKHGFREAEVPLVDPETVSLIFKFLEAGLGSKAIAKEVGVARNTVRHYRRLGRSVVLGDAIARRRPERLVALEARVHALLIQEAEGNAVVVQRLLAAEGQPCSLRTVQRLATPMRREIRRTKVATVRFETGPGMQMQIDFGQKWVEIGKERVRVYLFVAVLGFSRRIFVRAGLSERQEDWQEGISLAFQHFGGSTTSLLIDNPKAMVLKPSTAPTQLVLHPAFKAFCDDWELKVRACKACRAQTKGKVESGVKYVKRNALAGLPFTSFAVLERHLRIWMQMADARVHGTTHQAPQELFEAQERAAMRALPRLPIAARTRRLRRRVANDAMINVDTTRYSVPHRFVREVVEVCVGDAEVHVYAGGACVATHARSLEPNSKVVQEEHYAGLLRLARPQGVAVDTATSSSNTRSTDTTLTSMGQSLADYASVLEGEVPHE